MTLAASDGSDQTALQVSAVLSEPSLVTSAISESAISEVTQTVEPTVILVGWLVVLGPLRQYFILYRTVSRREGERTEK